MRGVSGRRCNSLRRAASAAAAARPAFGRARFGRSLGRALAVVARAAEVQPQRLFYGRQGRVVGSLCSRVSCHTIASRPYSIQCRPLSRVQYTRPASALEMTAKRKTYGPVCSTPAPRPQHSFRAVGPYHMVRLASTFLPLGHPNGTLKAGEQESQGFPALFRQRRKRVGSGLTGRGRRAKRRSAVSVNDILRMFDGRQPCAHSFTPCFRYSSMIPARRG